jgi:hypothetical protein
MGQEISDHLTPLTIHYMSQAEMDENFVNKYTAIAQYNNPCEMGQSP